MTAAKRPDQLLPVGRPSDYDPSYCDLVELKMSEGYSLTAFAGFVGVCKATIKNWAKENPQFLAAVMRAKAKRMYCWETKGINAGDKGGGPGASTIIMFTLRNLDRGSGPDLDEPEWADVQRVQHAGDAQNPVRIERVIVYPTSQDQYRPSLPAPTGSGEEI